MKFRTRVRLEFEVPEKHFPADQLTLEHSAQELLSAIIKHHLREEHGPIPCFMSNPNVKEMFFVCRTCAGPLNFTTVTHPMDMGLCYDCNDTQAELDLGMI